MAPVTHQTIRLSKGKHSSPQEGACVMELASMLAGEPFTDRPASVCPVIASFLRAYNDSIDDERRQDLYAYAAKVVGSRASEGVQSSRAEHLITWVLERRPRPWSRLILLALLRSVDWGSQPDVAARRALRAISKHGDRTHAEVLALIDRFVGDRPSRPCSRHRLRDRRRALRRWARREIAPLAPGKTHLLDYGFPRMTRG